MKIYTILISLIFLFQDMNKTNIVNFNNNTSNINWSVVNDGVMGGLSKSTIEISNNKLEFSGNVSLENNGGFASVRGFLDKINLKNHKYLEISLKGDKKNYQIRLRPYKNIRWTYIYEIETTGEWQNIKINLNDFRPYFRGYFLRSPNFNHSNLSEIGILIGNKKKENFNIKIEKINLTN